MIEIGKIVVSELNSYTELALSFAVALCGGIIALYSQVLLKPEAVIRLRGQWASITAFTSSLLSATAGFFAKSGVTASVPKIMQLDFSSGNSLTEILRTNGLNHILILNLAQFILLALGFVLIFVFCLFNIPNGRSSE